MFSYLHNYQSHQPTPFDLDEENMECLWDRITEYSPEEVCCLYGPGTRMSAYPFTFLHWAVQCAAADYDLAKYICSQSYHASNAAAIVAHNGMLPLHAALHPYGLVISPPKLETIKLLVREFPGALVVKDKFESEGESEGGLPVVTFTSPTRQTPLQSALNRSRHYPNINEIPAEVIQLLRDCTEAYENNNIRRVCQLCNGISIYRLHLRITFLCCLKFFDKADSKAQRRAKRAKTGGVLRARELLPREVWSVVLSFI